MSHRRLIITGLGAVTPLAHESHVLSNSFGFGGTKRLVERLEVVVICACRTLGVAAERGMTKT